MAQVKIDSRRPELKSNVHIARLRVYFNKADSTFKVLFIAVDRYIAIRIIKRNAEPGTGNYILCIFRNERRRVVTCAVGQLYDLRRAECFQVYPSYPGSVIGVGKYPAPVNFPIGLRQFNMVQIIPGHFPV